MMARISQKGSVFSLLMRVQTGIATLKISAKVPHQNKIWISRKFYLVPLLEIFLKRSLHIMLIAASFTIARKWKHSQQMNGQ